mgnify:CR=1 FL=1
MTLQLVKCLEMPAVMGISGHAGCGHAHSHCGFVQDDSGGLAAVLMILQRATGLDLTITQVKTQTGVDGWFEVSTASGGCGRAYARRGITLAEKRLAEFVVGRQAICTQALASTAFGRIYGQGAMEVAVALQTAIANAALDSFVKAYPEQFLSSTEGVSGNVGRVIGTKLDIDGQIVSLLAVVNATDGGLGPNEDVEGNVDLGVKGDLMKVLGLDRLPTFLIEGKVCASPASDMILEPTFLVRAFPGDDNVTVAKSYVAGAKRLGYPVLYLDQLLGRHPTAMRDLTKKQGETIISLGQELAKAETAIEKVRIAAELNRFCSQELGGITFMSESIHRVMGGVGMIPGTCGCLSLFISHAQLAEDVIPVLSEADASRFADVILAGVADLANHLDEANEEMERVRTHYRVANEAIRDVAL